MQDDPEVYHGAPAAVQILGGRLEEEKVLAIGQVVVDALERFQARSALRAEESGETKLPATETDL